MIPYKKTSPYFQTSAASGYLEFMNFRNIPAYLSDTVYELTEVHQYRPDLLASDVYDTPDLWWVFAVRNINIIKDPIFDFKAGIRIYIPEIDTINKALGL